MKNTTQHTTQRSSNFVKKFICEKCDYSCSKKGDFNKHLRSKKHNTTNTTAIQQQLSYTCECGKVYNHRASLYNHKKKCTHTEPAEEEETTTSKDPLSEQPMFLQMIIQYFETLRQSEQEQRKSEQEQRKSEQEQMGNMMKEIVKGNQEATKELVNKFIEIAPKMGNNTTNNNNNNDNRKITFNYYLENNCKDAETIHDFVDRYSLKCGDYFRENARAVVERQVSLAVNAHRLFFECLRENPQHMNFVQTSNVHDGIHYVKEKERIKENNIMTLYGEAEFRKYTDKFQKKGFEISSAVYRVLRVIQEETYDHFKRKCRKKPQESDYEGQYSDYVSEYMRDMEDYNNQYEYSTEHNCSLKTSLMDQVFSVINLFDTTKPAGKKTCKEILEMSRYSTKSQLLC